MMTGRLGVRRGLTLVELLVVVTVLSIAVALVIPSVSQTGVLRVQSAVRTIASDIALAQTEAMAFQTRRAIFFGAVASDEAGTEFAAGNGYVVVEPTGTTLTINNLPNYLLYMPDKPGQPFARNFNENQYGGATIENATFDGLPYLAFDELGGPLKSLASNEPGSGGTIVVEAAGFGVAYSIGVEAMTGRVTVNKIEDEADDEGADEEDEGGGLEGPGFGGEIDGGAPEGMGAEFE